jgi:hypothetical protein
MKTSVKKAVSPFSHGNDEKTAYNVENLSQSTNIIL